MTPIQAIALFTIGIVIGMAAGSCIESNATRKELVEAGLGSYTVDAKTGTVTFKLKG